MSTNGIRTILHLDLDAFYCAVEERENPALSGRPFAVGGRPDQRGVVASCSYAARQYGVRSAMPMRKALALCPDLLVVPMHRRAYSQASRQVMDRLREVTPLVEQISIDEAFLDVSDLDETGETIARRLQRQILDELSLPCSLGVATNKLVAKIASDKGKKDAPGGGPPNAITVVPAGEEAQFLADLSVDALWGIGPKTAQRLGQLGIETIGDLAEWPVADLERRFGRHGSGMAQRALGVDESPIVTQRTAKSFSQEITFSRDVNDARRLRSEIDEQSKKLSSQLQKRKLGATTIKVKLRWPNFTTLTRQTTLSQPIDQADQIAKTAWWLLRRVWEPGLYIRLLGVGVSGFREKPRQMDLWH